MIVRLRRSQLQRIEKVAPAAALEALHFDRRVIGGVVEVRAPYAAWEIAKEALMEEYLTRAGGWRGRPVSSAITAMKQIARAQNSFLRHPALREMGLLGLQHGWFPVWEMAHAEPRSRRYHPLPIPGAPFVVLGPVWHTDHRGTATTTWSPAGLWPKDDWLAQEASHHRVRGVELR